MSNSLTRRTTLGLFPLVLGVLLRHYYSKLLKGKGTGKECVAVPLRNKELMYDEAFSILRVSYSSSTSCPFFSSSLEFHGYVNKVHPSQLSIKPC